MKIFTISLIAIIAITFSVSAQHVKPKWNELPDNEPVYSTGPYRLDSIVTVRTGLYQNTSIQSRKIFIYDGLRISKIREKELIKNDFVWQWIPKRCCEVIYDQSGKIQKLNIKFYGDDDDIDDRTTCNLFTYDETGKLDSISVLGDWEHTEENEPSNICSFSYNEQHLPVQIDVSVSCFFCGNNHSETHKLVYNENGTIGKYNVSSDMFGNEFVTYNWSISGNLISEVHEYYGLGSRPPETTTYEYNDLGDRVNMKLASGGRTTIKVIEHKDIDIENIVEYDILPYGYKFRFDPVGYRPQKAVAWVTTTYTSTTEPSYTEESEYFYSPVVSSTSEFVSQSRYIVYPNPATELIEIQSVNVILPEVISLYDITGKLVIQKVLSRENRISVEHLNRGMYIFKLKDQNTITTGKIILL